MTRNENPNPEIGWASKVPDNHCHKSSRHINLSLEKALLTAERQGKAPAGKRSSAMLWKGGAHSTDRSVSETQRHKSSDAEVRRRDPTHPNHQGENTKDNRDTKANAKA